MDKADTQNRLWNITPMDFMDAQLARRWGEGSFQGLTSGLTEQHTWGWAKDNAHVTLTTDIRPLHLGEFVFNLPQEHLLEGIGRWGQERG